MKFSLVAAAIAVATVVEGVPTPTPPGIPTTSAAQSQLAALSVRTTDATGYSRSKFPHWITIHGACNTREEVLKRDGIDV